MRSSGCRSVPWRSLAAAAGRAAVGLGALGRVGGSFRGALPHKGGMPWSYEVSFVVLLSFWGLMGCHVQIGH